MTRITHPDIPGSDVEVPASAVPFHRAAGWVLVEEAGAPGLEAPVKDTETPRSSRRASAKDGN